MHPIAVMIVTQGVDSVQLHNVPPAVAVQAWNEAAHAFLHDHKYREAAASFVNAGNTEKLREYGAWYMQQKMSSVAAQFLVHVADVDALHALAATLASNGDKDEALLIYRKLGDAAMVSFVLENI